MNIEQLEHVLRAAAGITGADRFVIIGSQAILATAPHAPSALLVSVEVDLFTFRSPADADLIDGTIGEFSPFHRTFGYYAHGVGRDTAVLPEGWEDRLVPVKSSSTGGAVGLALEVNDLATSKLAAGRDKDIDFLRILLEHGLADASVIRSRLSRTSMPAELKSACSVRLARIAP